ncbi:hypothetical protein P154DRAFT_239992 [Amniculicola lignicola CBS 123094]|uniref:Uncharacterized protein n=1 Tax=Amniculicola lignicola CBS 123094 TaxID=1392246 RepID=A0A6A5WF98_9PLEO|nr:hypothetical protein P154DRAFT_239992 [Amniculicola lignicola CBS 123094]
MMLSESMANFFSHTNLGLLDSTDEDFHTMFTPPLLTSIGATFLTISLLTRLAHSKSK